MYRELQTRLGMARVIVVQANAYQDDNRVTLAAIKELGAGAKGVAVVKAGVADAEIERLTKAGICGQRIFNLAGGAVSLDAMDAGMARVHPFGWYANNKPRAAAPLDLLLDWAPDDATRRKIFPDNPAELFGFPKA